MAQELSSYGKARECICEFKSYGISPCSLFDLFVAHWVSLNMFRQLQRWILNLAEWL